MGSLIDPLNSVLFHLGADAVSWAEVLGFVTGLVTVALTVKVSVHCFWTGIANSAFFLVLFWTAHLWADSALQIVYIVMGFLGWWEWLYGGVDRTRLVVRRAPKRVVWGLSVLAAVATVVLYYVLKDAHDVAPFWDAVTTALSLCAQWLLNTKRIEQWAFWIIADVIYVPLYFSKSLDLTGIVYVCFLSLAISGAVVWRRALQAQFVAGTDTRGLVRA